MLKWVAIFLGLALAAVCLGAMGVGPTALTRLLFLLAGMVCVALLIAWPFLRKRTPP